MVESRPLRRPRVRAAPAWPCAAPGATPTTSTSPAPPRPACPCCGPRAATPTPWPRSRWPCSSPPPAGRAGADRDVRAGEIYKDGTIPYQRFRAWQLAGTDRRPRRPRRGRARPAVAARGPRHGGRRLRPLRRRRHRTPSTSSSSVSDVVSMHAPVTAETTGMIGADAVRRHAGRRRLPQHGPGRTARHRRPGRGAALGQGGGRRARPLRRRVTCPSTTRSPTSPAWCSPPTSAGATYNTEANHTRIIAEDLCRLLAGARPLHIVNPEVLEGR